MVEGARLEIVYAATYRGFESPLLRQSKSSCGPLGLQELLLFAEKMGDLNHRYGGEAIQGIAARELSDESHAFNREIPGSR